MTRSRWSDDPDVPRGDVYDARFQRLAEQGHDVHGEAALVERLSPSTVLDAGCGTGRVGIELSRRGIEVVGVDLDAGMLETARRNGPYIEWRQADLTSVDLERTFDVVLMAGNVMIFVEPGTEGSVTKNMARHLAENGSLVAGFQLRSGEYGLDRYDADCAAAGLELVERFATWDGDPYDDGSYAVSVHRQR